MKKACAVTGHRPTRFKFKYQEEYSLCKKIKKGIMEQLRWLHDERDVRRIYIGGTLGVDLWTGEIALRLKETPGYEEIELAIVLPFPGHDAKWDDRSRKRLQFLIQHSAECFTIGEQNCQDSYIKRNRYMVNHADYLLAIYDNDRNTPSDPIQAVRYAEKKKKEIILIHPDTAQVSLLSVCGGKNQRQKQGES